MKTWLHATMVIVAGACCMAPGCNGDVLHDSTFRLWCLEGLCAWKLEAGTVRRIATWHPDDYGVELVETPTVISQDTDEGSDCMEFSAVADVDPAAQVTVRIDFDFDGVPEFEAPIAATDWRVAKTLIHAPDGFGANLRLSVKKAGNGHAALAEIRLQRVDSCSGPRIDMEHRALGDACTADSQCASGICSEAPLPSVDGGTTIWPGVCQQCDLTHACTGGAACAKRTDVNVGANANVLPSQCAPGGRAGAAGAPCLEGNDCASGTCDGALLRMSPSCTSTPLTCPIGSVRSGQCR